MVKKLRTIGLLATILLLMVPSFGITVNAEQKYEYGGEYKMAGTEDHQILPITNTANYNLRIFALMYDRLVITDQNWQPVPWLAESWEFSEDGLSVTFHLVQNATFHDGDPVTSEDVKFTYDYSLEHKTPYVINPDGDAIDHITTPDPYTVVFHLSRPAGTSFVERLCTRVFIVKKSEWEGVEDPFTYYPGVGTGLTGSGPFKFVKQESGQYLELEANEDYWKGRPYIDKYFSIVVPQHDMQLMAFQTGELDAVALNPTDVAKVLGLPGKKVFKTEAPGFREVSFNNRRPPFNDVNLRRALSYCIDRDFLIETVYLGFAYPNLRHLQPPYGDWVNPDIPVYLYNITKASELLDEAGYIDQDDDGWRDYPDGSPLDLTMCVSTSDIYVRMAEVVTESMQEVGINIELEAGSGPAFWNKVRLEFDYDCYLGGWTPDSSWPGEMLSWYTTPMAEPGGLNRRGFSNSTYDALDLQAAAEQDPEKLKEILYEMQMILAEQCPNALVIRNHGLMAVNVEKWEGYENALPFGPLSYLDEIGFMKLHLKGAIAVTQTQLSLTAPSTGTTDERVSVSATMTTEDGDPVEGVYVDFSADGVIFASGRTDSSGKATASWLPETEGDIDFKVEYLGSAEYASCESETKITSVSAPAEPGPAEPEEPEPTPKDNTMLYLVGALAVIAIAVALYLRQK